MGPEYVKRFETSLAIVQDVSDRVYRQEVIDKFEQADPRFQHERVLEHLNARAEERLLASLPENQRPFGYTTASNAGLWSRYCELYVQELAEDAAKDKNVTQNIEAYQQASLGTRTNLREAEEWAIYMYGALEEIRSQSKIMGENRFDPIAVESLAWRLFLVDAMDLALNQAEGNPRDVSIKFTPGKLENTQVEIHRVMHKDDPTSYELKLIDPSEEDDKSQTFRLSVDPPKVDFIKAHPDEPDPLNNNEVMQLAKAITPDPDLTLTRTLTSMNFYVPRFAAQY